MLGTLTIATFSAIGAYIGKEFDGSGGVDYIRQGNAPLKELVVPGPENIPYLTSTDRFSIDGDISYYSLRQRKLASILNRISKLDYDWDGYGAKPISRIVIANIIEIGRALFNWDFSLWQVSPSVNGDVYINYKGKDKLAGILVGESVFTYFVEQNGKLFGKENCEFNIKTIVNIMRRISA